MKTERTGEITAVGTQVGKNNSTMFIELDGTRINLTKGEKVTIIFNKDKEKKQDG